MRFHFMPLIKLSFPFQPCNYFQSRSFRKQKICLYSCQLMTEAPNNTHDSEPHIPPKQFDMAALIPPVTLEPKKTADFLKFTAFPDASPYTFSRDLIAPYSNFLLPNFVVLSSGEVENSREAHQK